MTFDPQALLDQAFEGSNSTKIINIPEGEYTAMIQDLEAAQWVSRDQTKSGMKLTMKMNIDDQKAREITGRDKVQVKHDVMLDFNEAGGIDTGVGKNIQLGRLREACGLNGAGPFSFRQLEGKVVKVRIGHRVDGDNIYDEVKGVTRMSA